MTAEAPQPTSGYYRLVMNLDGVLTLAKQVDSIRGNERAPRNCVTPRQRL